MVMMVVMAMNDECDDDVMMAVIIITMRTKGIIMMKNDVSNDQTMM